MSLVHRWLHNTACPSFIPAFVPKCCAKADLTALNLNSFQAFQNDLTFY